MREDLIERLRREAESDMVPMDRAMQLMLEAADALEAARKVCEEVSSLLEKLETTCTHDSIIIDECWRLLEEVTGD